MLRSDSEIRRGRRFWCFWAIVMAILLTVATKNYLTERRLEALRDEPKVLIYEMYPRAWSGGLPAMTAHLPRVAALQADYVWLTPCFPSGGTDGGYDITDYTAIDPALGTMEDFDTFVRTANELGIKVVLDLVLNHTSDQHEWFQKSVAGEEPYADYYLWSDQDLGWGTMFDGSSAFEWNEQRAQYYCHIYHKSQPDLNWDNPQVRQEFKRIIDFWTDEHGVDGFRIDSVQLIGKDFSKTLLSRGQFGTVAGLLKYYQIAKTPALLAELFDGRDLFTFGEMTAPVQMMFNQMVAPKGPLSAGLNLAPSNSYDKLVGFVDIGAGIGPMKPSLKRLERELAKWGRHPGYIAMLESHDVPRFTSRTGLNGKEALSLLFESNAHMIALYQGQELGLTNPDLGSDITSYQDIQTIMRYEKAVAAGEDPQEVLAKLKPESRDNARVPLDLSEYAQQEKDDNSCLHCAQQLIENWKTD